MQTLGGSVRAHGTYEESVDSLTETVFGAVAGRSDQYDVRDVERAFSLLNPEARNRQRSTAERPMYVNRAVDGKLSALPLPADIVGAIVAMLSPTLIWDLAELRLPIDE